MAWRHCCTVDKECVRATYLGALRSSLYLLRAQLLLKPFNFVLLRLQEPIISSIFDGHRKLALVDIQSVQYLH